jgi:Flp pilus assembly protein TadD
MEPGAPAGLVPTPRAGVAVERATQNRSFPLIDTPQRDLLCALAYVYLACGQNVRALALLRLAERERPSDVGVLRVLAYALLAVGQGEEALDLVGRLEALDTDPEARTPLLLLRSHALRLAGRLDEAKQSFRDFVAARSQGRA